MAGIDQARYIRDGLGWRESGVLAGNADARGSNRARHAAALPQLREVGRSEDGREVRHLPFDASLKLLFYRMAQERPCPGHLSIPLRQLLRGQELDYVLTNLVACRCQFPDHVRPGHIRVFLANLLYPVFSLFERRLKLTLLSIREVQITGESLHFVYDFGSYFSCHLFKLLYLDGRQLLGLETPQCPD